MYLKLIGVKKHKRYEGYREVDGTTQHSIGSTETVPFISSICVNF